MINAGGVLATLDLDTGKFSTKLAAAQASADGFASKLKGYGGASQELGKGLTLGLTVPIVGIGVAAGKTAIDFESAFAGVRKTVNASEEDFGKLEKGIRDMTKEIPASATAISGVAEAAGQLGIETDSILDFTKVMIDLGESTNLSADEAATSLARLANITGMSQGDFDKLGSTIVDLGNNLATTEAEIVGMGLRLAGAGSQIGLSEAQIMSFAGALSSVGIEAEAGGSAFSKVMIDMQLAVETNSEKLQDFASVAGMSGKEFKKAFKDDAAGAIITFIQGLGNAEEKGMSAIKVLDDMGITEIRMRDALLRASGASDVFTESLEIGTKAWDENNALTKEAEQRYATTASQIGIANNHLKDAGIIIGEFVVPHFVSLAEGVKNASEWFSNLNPEAQETIVKMAGLAAAIGPVLLVGGKAATGLSSIIGLFAKFSGGAAVATTATTALGTAGGAGALGGLSGGLGASVLAMAPWILGIGAVGVAAVATAKYLKSDAIPAFDLFDETISESTKKAVGNFLDLEKQATTSLNQLAWGGQEITHEMADKISSNFNDMSESIITTLEEQNHEALDQLNGLSDGASLIADGQRRKIVEILNKSYEEQIEKTKEGQDRINTIIEEALADGRNLYWTEEMEIKRIKESMKETAVRIMSESEEEQLAIMERLKAESGKISALQAAEVVQNSLEQKEKIIAEAEESYNEQMKVAGKLRLKGGAEAEMYADLVVTQAKKQKEESIARAEEMHVGVITEAKAQAKEHVDAIDWETGEIKSKWEELGDWFMRNPIIREIVTQEKKIATAERNDRLNPVSFNPKASSENMMNMFVEGIDGKRPAVERAVNDVARTAEDYLGFRSPTKLGPGSTADKWMPNMVQMFADGISNSAYKVKDAGDSLASKIQDSMYRVNNYIGNTVSIIEKEFTLWTLKNSVVAGSSLFLEQQLEMQRQKHILLNEQISATTQALDIAKLEYGEGSIEALNYKNALLDLQIQQQQLTNTIEGANKAMERQIGLSFDASGNAIITNKDGSKVGISKGNSTSNKRQKEDMEKYGDEIAAISDRQGADLSTAYTMWKTNEREKIFGRVPQYASGTDYHLGGLAWVGEQGPELIELPKASKVYSNDKSMDMANKSSQPRKTEINLHIGTLIADDYGLKQLERKLSNIRINESVRLGGV